MGMKEGGCTLASNETQRELINIIKTVTDLTSQEEVIKAALEAFLKQNPAIQEKIILFENITKG